MKSDPISPQGRQTVTVGDVDLTVETPPDLNALLDRAAAEDPQAVDAIPYYAILWPAARGLARYLWDHRAGVAGQRVVELGCGLGLPSMLAARLGARVLSTDFHPDNGAWLRHNAALNGVGLDYARLDWNIFLAPPTTDHQAQSDGLRHAFQLVVGSDLLYERRHLPALVCAIDALCAQDGHAVIADPGRDSLPLFVSCMEKNGWGAELIPVDDIYVCRFARRADTGD
ncbi:MAG TPA: methyltransferase domain-containing protein [Kiritimatiellia bacterium]|nr:methyltransferase domain-containing protein [Kiritimatiellia bacterium]HPS08820.1 methyltransferase domain-containing protein [Kiritimatiellia bacterium]